MPVNILKNVIVLFLFFFIINTFLLAQPTSSSEDITLGEYYFKKADQLYNKVDSCMHYSFSALPILAKYNSWNKYVYTLCGLNYCYEVLGKDSLRFENNLLAFKMAQRHLNPTHHEYILALNNIGINHSEIEENHLKALQVFKETHALVNKHHQNSQYLQGLLHENIGKMYVRLGDVKTALQYFDLGLEYLAKKESPSPVHVSKLHHKKAEAYAYFLQPTKAKKSIEKSLEVMSNSKKKLDDKYHIERKTDLIEINISLSDLVPALQDCNTLLRHPKLSPLQKGKLLFLKGSILAKEQDWKAATIILEQSIEIINQKGKKVDLAKIYQVLSKVYYQKKDWNTALLYQQKALHLLVPDAFPNDIFNTPNKTAFVISDIELVNVLEYKAQMLKELYAIKPKLEYLETALATYHYLNTITSKIRSFQQSRESKLFLLKQTKSFCEEALETAYLLFELTNEEKYIHDAFFFAEKSKSNLLFDEIKKKEFYDQSIVAEDFVRREYDLKKSMNFQQKILTQELAKADRKSNKKIKTIKKTAFNLQKQLTTLTDSIHQLYPIYSQLVNSAPINLEDFKNQLNHDEVVLEYFIGERNIYIFKILQTEIELIVLPNNFHLDELVQTLFERLKMLGNQGVENYMQIAYELYQKLIIPTRLTSNQQKLIIIPDAQLENIPFDILITKPFSSKQPKDLPYFLHNKIISYSYSATILHHQRQKNINTAKLLAIFPVFEKTARYLSESKNLSTAISLYISNKLWKEEATKSNTLNIISHYNIIHFSTHARANDAEIQQPTIDLIDKKLALSDLYTLDLQAHLVILSACETNKGAYKEGEGIMSLSRGFAFAGVPSLITSVDNVKEKSTSILMQHLYKNLAEGMTKDQALCQAKKTYLKNCPETEATPYWWGTFMAIGNMNSIPLQEKKWYSSIWVLGTIISIIFFILLAYIAFTTTKKA